MPWRKVATPAPSLDGNSSSGLLPILDRIARALEDIAFDVHDFAFHAKMDRVDSLRDFEKVHGPYSSRYLRQFFPETAQLENVKTIEKKLRAMHGIQAPPRGKGGRKGWLVEGWLAARYRIPPATKTRQG